LLLLLNPGSKIRDKQKTGSGIREKHPGSATLQETPVPLLWRSVNVVLASFRLYGEEEGDEVILQLLQQSQTSEPEIPVENIDLQSTNLRILPS
jgi:hypothetical protein